MEKAKSIQDQKFTVLKAWSSNYTHAKFWSERMKLKAVFGLFLSNSGVYRASEVFTLAYI